MKFSAAGAYLGAFEFGWDATPAIYRHDATYSIVLKENRYDAGSYCGDPSICPERNASAPNDPERYFITQLNPALGVEWRFRNTQTQACERVFLRRFVAAGLVVDDVITGARRSGVAEQ